MSQVLRGFTREVQDRMNRVLEPLAAVTAIFARHRGSAVGALRRSLALMLLGAARGRSHGLVLYGAAAGLSHGLLLHRAPQRLSCGLVLHHAARAFSHGEAAR